MPVEKVIWKFGAGEADGNAKQASLLGGKGANLAEMATLGVPVPPGFTIPTTYCKAYEADPAGTMAKVLPEVLEGLEWLTGQFGYAPLVSVRSGAPVSMPGMMDTILNVGMTQGTKLQEWSDRIGPRAALDSYRRLIQMLGSTAYGIPHSAFEQVLEFKRKKAGVEIDSQLTAGQLDELVQEYKKVWQAATQAAFPDDVVTQVRAAVEAVFKSWNNERAIKYRAMQGIDGAMGTAVTIQAMVFGNFDDNSGSGVAFTRDPSTGEAELMGEFLPNAQGEDVVAGIRTPLNLTQMQSVWPGVANELTMTADMLEGHYKDMMDLEFTVQQGKLYMLQCRVGKRTALAACRIAHDLVAEAVITPDVALKRLTRDQIRIAMRPTVDPAFKTEPYAVGLPAGVGVAIGIAVDDSDKAEELAKAGKAVVLVTHETTPDDIGGMAAAKGILTLTGGATCHAAVVARSLDKPCVVGCGKTFGGSAMNLADMVGKTVVIDGTSGRVWVDQAVPVIDGAQAAWAAVLQEWALDKVESSLQADHVPAEGPAWVKFATHWGDGEWLDQQISTLGDRDSTKGLVLDMTPPDGLLEAVDRWLERLYPAQAGKKWAVDAMNQIQSNLSTEKRDGLTILAPGYANKVKLIGGHPLLVADTIERLLSGRPVILDDGLREVIGSQETLNTLQTMAAASGAPISVAHPPVPGEYALYMSVGG